MTDKGVDSSKTHLSSILTTPDFGAFFYQAAPGYCGSGAGLLALEQCLLQSGGAEQGDRVQFSKSDIRLQHQLCADPVRADVHLSEVYFVGILNTLLVAAVGIVLATMLGFVIGIARLSTNFLIRKFATIYVEIDPQHAAAAAALLLVFPRTQRAARCAPEL